MRAGGAVGELVSGLLVADFNRTGAYIVVATSLFVALILVDAVLLLGLPPRARAARVGDRAAGAAAPPGPTTARAGARRRCAATSSASTPQAGTATAGCRASGR